MDKEAVLDQISRQNLFSRSLYLVPQVLGMIMISSFAMILYYLASWQPHGSLEAQSKIIFGF